MTQNYAHVICYLADLNLRATQAGGIQHPWITPAYSFRVLLEGHDLGAAIAGPELLVPGEPHWVLMIFWDPTVVDLVAAGSGAFELHYAGRVIGEGRLLELLENRPAGRVSDEWWESVLARSGIVPAARLKVHWALHSLVHLEQLPIEMEAPAELAENGLARNIHILYEACGVLPNPETATPGVLHAAELPAFLDVAASLDPLHAELGDASNEAYTSDPRWNRVVAAAARTLQAM